MFECSPGACVCFSSGVLSQSKEMPTSLTGDYPLPLGMSVCEWMVCALLMDWRTIQSIPASCPVEYAPAPHDPDQDC